MTRTTTRSTYHCPHCVTDSTTEVYDTRPYNGHIRRRRKCNSCASKFTTIEVPEDALRAFDLTSQASSVTSALNDTVQKFNLLRKSIRQVARKN